MAYEQWLSNGDVKVEVDGSGTIKFTLDTQTVYFTGTGIYADINIIADITVTDSPIDYIDITGLDGNNAVWYRMYLNILCKIDPHGDYLIYVNGDYTDTNYYMQYLTATDTTVASERLNRPSACFAWLNEGAMFVIDITKTISGYFKVISHTNRRAGSNTDYMARNIVKTNTINNITSLRIASSSAGGIGIGSRIILTSLKGV